MCDTTESAAMKQELRIVLYGFPGVFLDRNRAAVGIFLFACSQGMPFRRLITTRTPGRKSVEDLAVTRTSGSEQRLEESTQVRVHAR